MPETKYGRDTQRFNVEGIDLNRPVDSVKPNKLPYAKNIRSYQSGRIEPRQGMTDLGVVVAGQSPVHSIRRLNDLATSTYTRVIGTGTHLGIGPVQPFTDLDSGYSGDPLALVPWKPVVAAAPYMYVADRLRMRKVTVQEDLDTVGYPAPEAPLTVALANSPSYKVIDEFDATTGWTAAGTATIPGTISRTSGTIEKIAYDTGSSGWASVNMFFMQGVGVGERLTFTSTLGGYSEIATVQAVYPGSVAFPAPGYFTTTIASVIYDSGSSGMCSVVLTTPIEHAVVDALAFNQSTGESTHIVGIAKSVDDNISIRVNTTTTWVAGQTFQILKSFRVYLTNTYVTADTVATSALEINVAAGIGTITNVLASPIDLTTIATGVPAKPDDLMHISLFVDTPLNLTEIKVMLDVDATTNDFTRNFYQRVLRPSDLSPNLANQQALIDTQSTIASNQTVTPAPPPPLHYPFGGGEIIPNQVTTPSTSPIVYSQQLESGSSQWVDVIFRISDLIRVGTDDTRSLQNVAALRILVNCTAAVNVDVDAWWIGGGYGPDTIDSTAAPYFYRYRVRNPNTNVASNFSPPTRYALDPHRQQVALTMPQYTPPAGTTLATTDFVLDIARFGGQIADWHYLATVDNTASPGFIDTVDDDVVAGNPILANDNYQPWPIKGLPVAGTTTAVSGTSITGNGFNLSWAPGTRILINHLPYTIYRVHTANLIEIIENAGSQGAVAWRIDEPTLLAQPLPCLWTWDNRFFACGDDTYNAGRLYYSNPNSETTTETNYLDITSPSEPLMNGLSYNVRSFVFSSDNFIQILNTGNPDNPYTFQIIPNGEGMFSRWFLTREPSPIIMFGGKDGIYQSTGGTPTSATDADLYNLFPTEGNPGSDVNGVIYPKINSAVQSLLRLHWYDEFCYFDYATVIPPVSVNVEASGLLLTASIGMVTVEATNVVVPCPGFDYMSPITIDHTKVAADLTDFPVLIDITDARLKSVGNGGHVQSSDGFDIRPVDNAGSCNNLTYELESGGYNPATGRLLMWVLIPNVSSTVDTKFYLAYGNALLTTDGSSSAVWADYCSVVHLQTAAVGIGSSRESIHLPESNLTMWVGYGNCTPITAQIGNGLSCDGTTDLRYEADGFAPSPFKNTADSTWQAWINTTATSCNITGRSNYLRCSIGLASAAWFASIESGGEFSLTIRDTSGSNTQTVTSTGPVNDGADHHIYVTRVGGTLSLYIDGVLDTTDVAGSTTNVTDDGGTTEIGAVGYTLCSPSFIGIIDEWRAQDSIARDADWVETDYNNQNNNATFITLGTEF